MLKGNLQVMRSLSRVTAVMMCSMSLISSSHANFTSIKCEVGLFGVYSASQSPNGGELQIVDGDIGPTSVIQEKKLGRIFRFLAANYGYEYLRFKTAFVCPSPQDQYLIYVNGEYEVASGSFSPGFGLSFEVVSIDAPAITWPVPINRTATMDMLAKGTGRFESQHAAGKPKTSVRILTTASSASTDGEVDPSNLIESMNASHNPLLIGETSSSLTKGTAKVFWDTVKMNTSRYVFPIPTGTVTNKPRAVQSAGWQDATFDVPYRYDYSWRSNRVRGKVYGTGAHESAGQLIRVYAGSSETGHPVLVNPPKAVKISLDQNLPLSGKTVLSLFQTMLNGAWVTHDELVFDATSGIWDVSPLVEPTTAGVSMLLSSPGALKKRISLWAGAPDSNLNLSMALTMGDVDGDNYIGTDDYLILSSYFDADSETCPEWTYSPSSHGVPAEVCDLNGDLFVNTDDYLIFSGNYDMVGDE